MAVSGQWRVAVPGVALTVAVGALLLATCGSPDEGAQAPSSTATTSTTTAPVASTTTTSTTTSTTVAPSTTTSTTTTSSTTTTTTTTTTAPTTTTTTTLPPTTTTQYVAPLSQPITPPTDARAAEPVIELGSIYIPAIDVNAVMYEGIRMTTLDLGPGHWPGSAMPGQPGNVVVGGHRTSKHKVFRRVDELVAGDEIVFTMPDGVYKYVVNRVEIVDPSAVWIVDPTATPQATLFACHPPGSTRQRIIVFSDLVSGP
jgi:sortase A